MSPGGPPPRRWVLGLGLAVVAVLAVTLAVVQWSLPPRAASSAPPEPMVAPLAIEAPAPAAEPPAEPAAPSGEAVEPPPPEFVRVGNTGGQGILLRREPGVNAARLVARAENSVLQVVGSDVEAEGRVWRFVQDAQGNQGWAPADFLAPVAPPS